VSDELDYHCLVDECGRVFDAGGDIPEEQAWWKGGTARRLSVPFAVLLAMIEVGLKSRSGLVVRATISFAPAREQSADKYRTQFVRPSVSPGV
jgi:hypothetical protein